MFSEEKGIPAAMWKWYHEQYPPQLSAEQVRQILHIHKKKCSWMLQNGVIPCIDNGKKTRRYTIALDDVLLFAADSQAHPQKYRIPAIFTDDTPEKRAATAAFCLYPQEAPHDFRLWLEHEFSGTNDTLDTQAVAALLGYHLHTVQYWIHKGWMQAVQVRGKNIVARAWVIDFCCGYGYKIGKKSEKHLQLLRKYFG